MPINVIVGEQRGDEGKGRFVDMLALKHSIVARFNGGNNAGHTVVLPDNRVLKLHLVPSGIAHPHAINIIGNGCLINPVKLDEEIQSITSQNIEVSSKNLKISSAAHLILPHHISADEMREAGANGQGSTKSGIAQVSAAKYSRQGLRCEVILSDILLLETTIRAELAAQSDERERLGLESIDIDQTTKEYIESAEKLKPFICDTILYLNSCIKSDSKEVKILAEGAQAFLLDIDHGMYPFTTSSSTTSGSVSTGLGVPPYLVGDVLGVSKAVQSHVGGGVFVTEIHDEKLLTKLHGDMTTVDAECGTTTGRTRRLGHLDLPGIRRSQMINGTTKMALTKLDWVPRYGDKVKVCTSYKIDGELSNVAPDSAACLEKVEPVYEELPTWSQDISLVRDFEDLPKEAKNYIEFLESQLGTPIVYIGVGPNREQVITRTQ